MRRSIRTALILSLGAAVGLGGTAVRAGVPTTPAAYGDQQLRDRAAIDALGIEFFYRLDHGLAETLPELFMPEGTQDSGAGAPPLQGREAIRDSYKKRSKTNVTRHVVTNLHITFEGPDRARVVRTLTFYSGSPPGPLVAQPSVGDCEEVLVRGKDGRWLYESRKVIRIFVPPGAPPPG